MLFYSHGIPKHHPEKMGKNFVPVYDRHPPLFDLTLAEKSVYVRLYGDQYGSFYHIPFNDTFVISKNFSTNKAENIIQSNKTLTRDPLTSKFMGV